MPSSGSAKRPTTSVGKATARSPGIPAVAWSIPLSLGDSHHGFPVLGTTAAYFEHFRYADSQALHFGSGQAICRLFDAVLGAEVAQRLGYRLGDRSSSATAWATSASPSMPTSLSRWSASSPAPERR
jgi:hypothetical protein